MCGPSARSSLSCLYSRLADQYGLGWFLQQHSAIRHYRLRTASLFHISRCCIITTILFIWTCPSDFPWYISSMNESVLLFVLLARWSHLINLDQPAVLHKLMTGYSVHGARPFFLMSCSHPLAASSKIPNVLLVFLGSCIVLVF